ncbi:MAG: hypothetical protein JXQ67_09945 [Campylobacterales bacterium]|nr:hypothetical protein [Campylobacterales bacterium]
MRRILPFVLCLTMLNFSLFAGEEKVTLSASLVGMSMDYREYSYAGELLDSEKSTLNEMIGSEFRIGYLKDEGNNRSSEFGINLTLLGGQTEYVGSLIDSGLGYGSYIGKTNNFIYDVSLDYKYSWFNTDGFGVSTGVGLGYRSWRRELSPNQVEVYTWVSLRPQLGVFYIYDAVKLSIIGEYQFGFDTKMAILANSENTTTSVNLGSADIMELNIPLSLAISQDVDLFVEYSYQEQKIGASNVVPYVINGTTYGIYEPESSASNHYFKLGATVKF